MRLQFIQVNQNISAKIGKYKIVRKFLRRKLKNWIMQYHYALLGLNTLIMFLRSS